jgi:hypothetical protein
MIFSSHTPMHYDPQPLLPQVPRGITDYLTAHVLKNPTNQPIHVMLPDGSSIRSSHEALLLFPLLPQATLKAHIFPDLQGQALLSMDTFCNMLIKITYQGH